MSVPDGGCLDHGHRGTNDEDLAILRAAFENGEPLGWVAVHAFEAQHEVVLPEPYRTFVAEICNGSSCGPLGCGLMELGPAVRALEHSR